MGGRNVSGKPCIVLVAVTLAPAIYYVALIPELSHRSHHTGAITQEPSHRSHHTGDITQEPSHRRYHTASVHVLKVLYNRY